MTGKTLPIAKLDEGARCNPDGSGYAFIADGKVRTRRSLNWANLRIQFEKDVVKYGATSPFLIHHRIKSHGPITKENCHPFMTADGSAFIHNGIIPLRDLPDGYSDTRWFVEHIIDQLPKNWYEDSAWCQMVAQMITSGSKAVMLLPDAQFLIFNQSAGQWENEAGVKLYGKIEDSEKAGWYSNDSCRLPAQASQWKAPVNNAGGSNPKAAGAIMKTSTTAGINRAPINQRALPFVHDREAWIDKPIPSGYDPTKWRRKTGEEYIIEMIPHNERNATDAEVMRSAERIKPVLAAFLEAQGATERLLYDEMLSAGLCIACGADQTTRARAVVHVLFQCEDFRRDNPDVAIKLEVHVKEQ